MVHTNILDSELHRPPRLATETTDDQRVIADFLGQAVGGGMDPTEVADKVIAALRADRFLILTHDAYPQLLVERVDALVDRRLPPVPDFP
jgi:hypothetical protein